MSVLSAAKQVDLQNFIIKFISTENILMEKWKHVLLVEMEDGKANMTTIHSFSSACAQLKSLIGRTVENACKEILKRLPSNNSFLFIQSFRAQKLTTSKLKNASQGFVFCSVLTALLLVAKSGL